MRKTKNPLTHYDKQQQKLYIKKKVYIKEETGFVLHSANVFGAVTGIIKCDCVHKWDIIIIPSSLIQF